MICTDKMNLSLIRNFAIIAHIDHGKSTLADRLIEACGNIDLRHMTPQILDSMELEKERGITIKSQTANLIYKASNGEEYNLNLIDTPGHVDFGYEVSRSLASCEGAILLVDACSGVQAQTLANFRIALRENLVIIPVINKIDLPGADIARCIKDMKEVLNLNNAEEAILCSAKANIGIRDILEAIVKKIPHPKGDINLPFRARIIDSWYDSFAGVVSLVRVYDGILKKGEKVLILSTQKTYKIDAIGKYTPFKVYTDNLSAGQVKFIYAGIKEIHSAPVGDTITEAKNTLCIPLGGFIPLTPKIYAGLFPSDSNDFKKLRPSLEKLSLNDSSFVFEAEHSPTLGYGFRCGFLGLLHLEIIKERILREYEIDLIVSSPSVPYKVKVHGLKKLIDVNSPSNMPPSHTIEYIEEPISLVTIITPHQYLGDVMNMCHEKFGIQKELIYNELGAVISYEMPLIEIIHKFSDKLKSLTSGYASFEYQEASYQKGDIVVLKILINDDEVEALASFSRKSKAVQEGNQLVEKLVQIIPRSQFSIKIQAAVNSKSNIIARGDIKAFRKNVTGKCYGGDRTRKMKLLENQKKGKQKMKSIGKVDLPSSTFISIFKD